MQFSEKASLYRELAKLTETAFHLDRTLDLLLRQNPSRVRKTWLLGLQKGLKAGLSVSEAVHTHNQAFSGKLETALISAGERSGRLADSFRHLARYFNCWNFAVKQMRSSMIYPLVLVHLGILLPEIPAWVTAEMNGADGLIIRILFMLLMLWTVIALVVLLWHFLSKMGTTDANVERWLWRIPIIGGIRNHWALARFTQVFNAGLLAGMRISECMLMAGVASNSGVLNRAASHAAQKIAEGETVGSSMSYAYGFPTLFTQSISTAEQAGTLDLEMRSWATSEMIEAENSIQRASNWLPKIFYAAVSIFVVCRLIRIVSEYYHTIGSQIEAL